MLKYETLTKYKTKLINDKRKALYLLLRRYYKNIII